MGVASNLGESKTPLRPYEDVLVMCKCHTISYKDPGHSWISVSVGSPGINPSTDTEGQPH
jgi:hypothetical protein